VAVAFSQGRDATLALDRLARHYGFVAQARGPARVRVRTWLADNAAFVVDGETGSCSVEQATGISK
jgi:hypothetical protein